MRMWIFCILTFGMMGISPEVTMHYLNVDLKVEPVKKKLRAFGPKKDAIIKVEVEKILRAGHVEKVQFPV